MLSAVIRASRITLCWSLLPVFTNYALIINICSRLRFVHSELRPLTTSSCSHSKRSGHERIINLRLSQLQAWLCDTFNPEAYCSSLHDLQKLHFGTNPTIIKYIVENNKKASSDLEISYPRCLNQCNSGQEILPPLLKPMQFWSEELTPAA